MENKTGIIVAFHKGRGGRFNNGGHTTFIGQKEITEFTNDLYIRFQNEAKILERFKSEKLRNLVKNYIADMDLDTLKELGVTVDDLGHQEYFCGASGSSVGLMVDNNGVGCIIIDGDYNTTSACHIEDCSESQIKMILENPNGNYISNEIDSFIKENWSQLIEE